MQTISSLLPTVDSREKLQEMVDKIVQHSEERGLSINLQKTECMVVSKRESAPACEFEIGNKPVKQVESFIYLGTRIHQDGRCIQEIERRIAMAKNA